MATLARLTYEILVIYFVLISIVTFTQAHDEWGGKVVPLTDSNFERTVLESDEVWLVCFYAPWCGHCRKLQPEYEKASRIISKEKLTNIKLGALDASTYREYAEKFGIQGFPTLLYFPAGPKITSDAKPYQGDRSSDSIVQWARNIAAEHKPPPELKELISEEVFHDTCESSQICIISVLPQLYDCQSKCRNRYIDRLKEVAKTYKTKPWGFLWLEARAQPKLEEALGIGGFGYPALAAVNHRKKAFTLMKGPFSTEGITEFLRDLYAEGSALLKSDKIPTINQTEPWDGKDKELPNFDDEL